VSKLFKRVQNHAKSKPQFAAIEQMILLARHLSRKLKIDKFLHPRSKKRHYRVPTASPKEPAAILEFTLSTRN
jgi:hypothetical protein